MKALITGASSGIGRDFAHVLGSMGCELILVARRENRMEELRNELPVPVQIICADLSSERECFALYEQVREEHIDILINNAGFGVFGAFQETDLTEELKLIDTNIRAVHILTKLFLKDFTARDAGYLLNVSSASAFAPGPLMAAYYASKVYVLHLTLAIWKELRRQNSRVSISALCPGPVNTEFDFYLYTYKQAELPNCGICAQADVCPQDADRAGPANETGQMLGAVPANAGGARGKLPLAA